MHRLIIGALKGQIVDHINGDPLDNRRNNLRICTPSQNQMNAKKARRIGKGSIYKGVVWNKKAQKWEARIKADGAYKYIGIYKTEEEAAEAYNEKAATYFGEFAKLNIRAHIRHTTKDRAV